MGCCFPWPLLFLDLPTFGWAPPELPLVLLVLPGFAFVVNGNVVGNVTAVANCLLVVPEIH